MQLAVRFSVQVHIDHTPLPATGKPHRGCIFEGRREGLEIGDVGVSGVKDLELFYPGSS